MTPMNQAEEIAYWQGYDQGKSKKRDEYLCRFFDPGLKAAWIDGFRNGEAYLMGQEPTRRTPFHHRKTENSQ